MVFSVPNAYEAKLESSLVTLNRSGGADTGARFGLNKKGTSAQTVIIDSVAPLNQKSDIMLLANADANSTDVLARMPFTLYKV